MNNARSAFVILALILRFRTIIPCQMKEVWHIVHSHEGGLRTSIHDEPSFFDEQHAVERFDPLKMVRDHNDRFLCENAHDGVEHLLFGNGIEPTVGSSSTTMGGS